MRIRVALVFTALLALTASRALAAPGGDAPASVSSLAASLVALINQVGGDDAFSTADLSQPLASPSGSNASQHYGPFPSGSPDSGTCGYDWAQDTFDRHFTVRNNGDGTFTVVEQFKNGNFLTNPGLSPGACDISDGTPPGTITAGKTGAMHGYEIITVTGTQTSTAPGCAPGSPPADCTTSGFLTSHFTGASTVGAFFFHYSAGDQSLVFHEWKNASCDRGGNHGDIASASPAVAPSSVNVCP